MTTEGPTTSPPSHAYEQQLTTFKFYVMIRTTMITTMYAKSEDERPPVRMSLCVNA